MSGRDRPDVSVIVPVYNKAKYVAACLDSILGQDGITAEIICIDDVSTDESRAIVSRYAQGNAGVRLLRNATRRGAAHSRNRGIEEARGAYLQFTDADDVLPVGSLNALRAITRRTDAEVARGNLSTLRHGIISPWPTEAVTTERAGTLLELPELWIPWFHPCYLISGSLLITHDVRYPELVAGEDAVFIAGVLTTARRICTIPTATYLYRQDEPRGTPTLRTVEDYLRHAQMVKKIYAGPFAPCWKTYQAFIKEDIRLLLRQAKVSLGDYRRLDADVDHL